MMKIRFWGVRGSIPVPGPSTVRVGGNTACVEVETEEGQLVILDAGTGIRLLGLDLARRGGRLTAVLLFSHTHWDHIQGLPFFSPARLRHNRLVILGERRINAQLEEALRGQMVDAYLPFTIDDLRADLLIKEILDGERIVLGEYTTIQPRSLEHPGGVLAYRIDCGDKAMVYASDVSHPLDGIDPRLVDLARGADLLIHDAHFTPEERLRYADWGHSSWQEAVRVAQLAEVARLALFHHAPLHDDDCLEGIERQAQEQFAAALLAREGLEISI
jgi:phosphoribosyl 1,2-cyclic phosphodiesterase